MRYCLAYPLATILALSCSTFSGCSTTPPPLTETTTCLSCPKVEWSNQLSSTLNQEGVQVIKYGDYLRIVIPVDTFFKPHSAKLRLQKRTTIIHIAQLLKLNGNQPIYLSGHSDNVGARQTKRMRTQQQAETIAAYLWYAGISLKRIQIRGMADQRPVATNTTPQGNADNRRIEIITLQ